MLKTNLKLKMLDLVNVPNIFCIMLQIFIFLYSIHVLYIVSYFIYSFLYVREEKPLVTKSTFTGSASLIFFLKVIDFT